MGSYYLVDPKLLCLVLMGLHVTKACQIRLLILIGDLLFKQFVNLRNNTNKHAFERDWTTCSMLVDHSMFDNVCNRKDLYDHFTRNKLLTFFMDTNFICYLCTNFITR
jgi:hypothetical protein